MSSHLPEELVFDGRGSGNRIRLQISEAPTQEVQRKMEAIQKQLAESTKLSLSSK
jgi:hypothetical protein